MESLRELLQLSKIDIITILKRCNDNQLSNLMNQVLNYEGNDSAVDMIYEYIEENLIEEEFYNYEQRAFSAMFY